MFSFNSPHGACPRCTGLGSQMEIDPELVVPDPSLSLDEGAILPWSTSASNYYEQITQAIAERYEIDMDTPWEDLPEDAAGLLPLRHQRRPRLRLVPQPHGRRRSYMTSFEGIVPNLERRYRETDSDWSREKIEEYMSVRPCPECKGARLRPESLAVTVGGLGDPRVHGAVGARRAIEWLEAAGADRPGPRDRAADPARDRRAAALPRQRRRRLPVAGAGGGHAVAAARRSGSGSRPRSARRSSACSTSSTSRRSACTSATTSG